MLRLTEIPEGSQVEVMDFSSEKHHPHRHFYHQHNRHRARKHQGWGWEDDKYWEYLERIGIRKGITLTVNSNPKFGPLMIKIDENILALGRGIAMKVLVRFV